MANVNDIISQSTIRSSADEQYRYFERNGQRQRVLAYEYDKYRRKLSKDTIEFELTERMKLLKKDSDEWKKLNEQRQRIIEENNKKAEDWVLAFEKMRYTKASEYDKQRLENDKINRLRAELEEQKAKVATMKLLASNEKAITDANIANIKAEEKLKKDLAKQLFKFEKDTRKRLIDQSYKGTKNEKALAIKALSERYSKERAELKDLKSIKEKDRTSEQKARIAELESLQSVTGTSGAKPEIGGLYRTESVEDYSKRLTESIADTIKNNINKGLDDIQNTISSFYSAQGSIEARLQGSGESYKQMTKLVSRTIGLSGYVSQKKMLENIKTLVEAGIAYNVEQRAFLATISENIASTFDAANGTLLRLIRLQQADSTQARLGMEASLTKFLNSMYSDTSYLNDLYDTVSSAVIDANSIMTRDQSLAFEYAIQKWLGSLASLGMSSNAITNIATGINYLATGNVGALSSNSGLQTLMAMSASRAGISYGSMLNTGLTAEQTNDLLEEMVKYLQEIASNQSNVVKSAYGSMFGLSLSDLRAISSLRPQDIRNIYGSSLTYSGATRELQSQMSKISSRVHLSQVMQNVYENYIGSVASDIGSSTGKYFTWMIADLLEKTVGGIPLPTVTVFGSGVDLNTSVAQLMKLGLVGYSTISQLGSLISSVGKRGNYDLNRFGFQEYLSRGKAYTGVAKGAERFDSMSLSAGSGMDESDVDSLTKQSTEKAKESVKSDEQEEGGVKDIWEALMSVISEDSDKSMRVTIVNSELPVKIDNWDEMPKTGPYDI